MAVVDPSSGAEIARVARGGVHDVDAAVAAAPLAFDTGPWPCMRPHEREMLMLRLADLLEQWSETLAQIETVSSGKLMQNTRVIDAGFSVHTLRYMAGWASKIAGRVQELSVPYAPGLRFT